MATQYRVLLDRTAEEAAVRQSRHAVHDRCAGAEAPCPSEELSLCTVSFATHRPASSAVVRKPAHTSTLLLGTVLPAHHARHAGIGEANIPIFNFLNCASVRTTRDSDSHHQIFGPLWQRVCHAAPFWPSWVGVTKALALCTKSLR